MVVFQVNHLTRFGIFQKKMEPEELPEKLEPNIPLPGKKPSIPQIPENTSPEIIEPQETEETVIKKIENFIDPMIPKFLKPKEKKITHTPESRDELREIWILILCILFLFLLFRRKRDKETKK